MATPRKEYPSDHRRWFRVMEDILDDPKLAECSAATCWLFVGLLAALNRMKSRDGSVVMPLRSLYAIARTRDWSATRPRLDALQNAAVISYERAGKSLALTVHKWAENQGFTPAELRPDSDETPCTTPTPTPTPKEQPSEPPSGETDPPAKNNGKPPKHPEAMRLAELLRDELAANVEHWTPPRSLRAWGSEFDRMLRLDGPQRRGIPPPDIERVIRWVVRDPFEAKNVQSASKLRKRFGALSAKARPEGYDPVREEFKQRMIAEGRMDADGNSISDLEDLDPNNMPDWAEALMGLDDV